MAATVQSSPAADQFEVKERKRLLFFGLPWTFTTYTLNNKKLILKEGFLNTTENEILLYRVLDITLKRSLGQRIFGLGSVVVEAQDKTHPQLVIKNIKRSQEFRERALRRRRGGEAAPAHAPRRADRCRRGGRR